MVKNESIFYYISNLVFLAGKCIEYLSGFEILENRTGLTVWIKTTSNENMSNFEFVQAKSFPNSDLDKTFGRGYA